MRLKLLFAVVVIIFILSAAFLLRHPAIAIALLLAALFTLWIAQDVKRNDL